MRLHTFRMQNIERVSNSELVLAIHKRRASEVCLENDQRLESLDEE